MSHGILYSSFAKLVFFPSYLSTQDNINISTIELITVCPSTLQAEWREEVKKHFEKIKSEGTCIHRLDEELIRRRRDELRCA